MNIFLISFLIIGLSSQGLAYKPCPHLPIDQYPLCFMLDGACACYKKRSVVDESCLAPLCNLNPPPDDPDCPKPYCFRVNGYCACQKK